MNDKTFIRITNRDIYEKLEAIEGSQNKLKGNITFHNWAIGVIITLIGILFIMG